MAARETNTPAQTGAQGSLSPPAGKAEADHCAASHYAGLRARILAHTRALGWVRATVATRWDGVWVAEAREPGVFGAMSYRRGPTELAALRALETHLRVDAMRHAPPPAESAIAAPAGGFMRGGW